MNAETAAVLAAGFVAPVVTGALRRLVRVSDLAATGLALVVSGGLAMAGMGMTHTLGGDWWANTLQALGIATVVYRLWKKAVEPNA